MAKIASAKKAHRQSLKRHVFNVRRAKVLKEDQKDLFKLSTKKEALAMLPKVYQAIDKAVKRGVIKQNTASRRKAKAAAFVAKLA